MEIGYLLIGLFGFALGAIFGKFMTDVTWSHNADEPKRILYKNDFYKVLRLHDYMSRSYLETVD